MWDRPNNADRKQHTIFQICFEKDSHSTWMLINWSYSFHSSCLGYYPMHRLLQWLTIISSCQFWRPYSPRDVRVWFEIAIAVWDSVPPRWHSDRAHFVKMEVLQTADRILVVNRQVTRIWPDDSLSVKPQITSFTRSFTLVVNRQVTRIWPDDSLSVKPQITSFTSFVHFGRQSTANEKNLALFHSHLAWRLVICKTSDNIVHTSSVHIRSLSPDKMINGPKVPPHRFRIHLL